MSLNSRTRWKTTRDALKGTHWGAKNAPPRVVDLETGDTARVLQTGLEGKITKKTSWGDFELEGVKGFFSKKQLELVKKGS